MATHAVLMSCKFNLSIYGYICLFHIFKSEILIFFSQISIIVHLLIDIINHWSDTVSLQLRGEGRLLSSEPIKEERMPPPRHLLSRRCRVLSEAKQDPRKSLGGRSKFDFPYFNHHHRFYNDIGSDNNWISSNNNGSSNYNDDKGGLETRVSSPGTMFYYSFFCSTNNYL